MEDPWLGRRLGNYELHSVLGRGGMASVYSATHVALGTRHAIKILEPVFARNEDLKARFLREGRVQAQFRHPGIARVTDTISAPAVALVLELLVGESLRSVLERGPIPFDTAVILLDDMAAALSYAHERGVVHRDIKPENVFLAEDERGSLRAVVLDFGIAQIDALSPLTQSGVLMGTPRYMSPEQMDDPRAVDERADVFSLAVLLFELLTGDTPHPGSSNRSVTLAILSGKFLHVSEHASVPVALDGVFACALAPDRADRYASVVAFAEAVRDALDDVGDVTDSLVPVVARPNATLPAATWPPMPAAEVQAVLQRQAEQRALWCSRCGAVKSDPSQPCGACRST